MIISPPFLPTRAPGQSEEAWLDVAMQQPASRLADTWAPEGSFPLGHGLAWHNGLHLQAPVGDSSALPARAIADGVVVFINEPTPQNPEVDHPQNYNPFDRGSGKIAAWTDNGCVILEHRTEIGSQGATGNEIVFYSLTMHLSTLGLTLPAGQTARRKLRVGDRVWRKEELGNPGQSYGHGGQIHFEICFDAANLQRLIGRAPNWVAPAADGSALPAPTADGRTDSVFGSIYVYLPASTPTLASTTPPEQHLRLPTDAAAITLGAAMWVKMTYGEGDCRFESFDEPGTLIGGLPAESDFEYDLYREATGRHNKLFKAGLTASSPSGWYELLRFGRNLGRGDAPADKDPLPANAAHWRRVMGPDRQIRWADLNCVGSYKFSDADFLPVMGWNCVSDDASPNDQRCDSVNLKILIRDPDQSNQHRMESSELARRLGNEHVRTRLMRLWCKFPSEWDKCTIAARYGFVKEFRPFKESPAAWARLQAHLMGVSFDGLPETYLMADWRVNPKELVLNLRRCGWKSAAELSRTFPRYLFYSSSGIRIVITEPTSAYSLSHATALGRIERHAVALNTTMRKYTIDSAKRQAHFLAQVLLETAQWRNIPPNRLLMHEWGFGQHSAANPMTQYYAAFYGRGIMQLTWVGNYRDYGEYRTVGGLPNNAGSYVERLNVASERRITQTSRHWTGNPDEGATQIAWAPRYDPDLIATDEFNACDSGGFYWVSKRHDGSTNINRVCDRDFTPKSVGRVNILVNGGGNGSYERQAYAAFIFRYLSDSTAISTGEEIAPPAPKARVRANFLKPT